MMTELKSSQEWLQEIQENFPQVVVLDPDGWDRKNYQESWNEPITREEFEKRFSMSTVQVPIEFINDFFKTEMEN
jgi:uncharacterized protein with von Willebrand factor type A (vWA) domain